MVVPDAAAATEVAALGPTTAEPRTSGLPSASPGKGKDKGTKKKIKVRDQPKKSKKKRKTILETQAEYKGMKARAEALVKEYIKDNLSKERARELRSRVLYFQHEGECHLESERVLPTCLEWADD